MPTTAEQSGASYAQAINGPAKLGLLCGLHDARDGSGCQSRTNVVLDTHASAFMISIPHLVGQAPLETQRRGPTDPRISQPVCPRARRQTTSAASLISSKAPTECDTPEVIYPKPAPD
jgi:hypothetical protein